MSENEKDRKEEIVVIHQVNLGFNVEEEIERSLKEEISEEVIEDAKDLIEAISDRPGNKKAIEKIEKEKKLEECVDIIVAEGKISKDKMIEITGMSIHELTNNMRAFCKKFHGKKFAKVSKSGDYGFAD